MNVVFICHSFFSNQEVSPSFGMELIPLAIGFLFQVAYLNIHPRLSWFEPWHPPRGRCLTTLARGGLDFILHSFIWNRVFASLSSNNYLSKLSSII